jgi:MFS transporter, OCT family, solute carrier family 22 (organic cation transporter), member 4/5
LYSVRAALMSSTDCMVKHTRSQVYCVMIQLINRLGRRLVSVLMFLCCGVACLLCAVIPSGEPGSTSATLRIVAAVTGKFGVAAAFALLFVFTTELFPTVVRSAALGANSAAARVGGIASPLVVLFAEAMHAGWLSFVIFGAAAVLAGTLHSIQHLSEPL